jgi:hypothetical protein
VIRNHVAVFDLQIPRINENELNYFLKVASYRFVLLYYVSVPFMTVHISF